MVRADPAANEIDQRPHVGAAGAAALRFIGRKAEGAAGTLRKLMAAVAAVEEREPCRSGQGCDLLAWEGGKRRAAHQQGERTRHLSAVIPAERRKAREPGSKYPCRGVFRCRGTWVPGLRRTTPLRFVLRRARDDSRGA